MLLHVIRRKPGPEIGEPDLEMLELGTLLEYGAEYGQLPVCGGIAPREGDHGEVAVAEDADLEG